MFLKVGNIMARGINKNIAHSTIFALNCSIPFGMDENNNPVPNMVFNMNGAPNMNVALREAIKRAKDIDGKPTKNVMIINIATTTTKVQVSASDFIANSYVCENGVVYGHEYITREFQITELQIMYVDKNGMHNETLIYDGKTTENKLLNFARDYTKCQNTCILSSKVKNERRYMTNEKYASLAKEVEENENENIENENSEE